MTEQMLDYIAQINDVTIDAHLIEYQDEMDLLVSEYLAKNTY